MLLIGQLWAYIQVFHHNFVYTKCAAKYMYMWMYVCSTGGYHVVSTHQMQQYDHGKIVTQYAAFINFSNIVC